ncbi:MAG: DUF445 domain-containing protein [Sulfurimonas sp. RIFOXYD12_FULL_33_39]|uniref:DUF445 domain-containing protein n=1 Tax=unclassified Sulfurimonas TaxID=2623549 RepID=UPI0008D08021|nr:MULTISPECIES: DUF445 domain-containing protein [unclassified Sulfurimonas]OHE07114.1 MAG: DUF445 domain-containing protein [Sulfurimonas sp. RIFCSPLOWO2_12_FULL_34_6]OHE09111.1 MAG: DUF445 domain-containing protein [Sulfurimonas sp. RIFOXYD12_FULL_33_39]OHE14428.1 MAG: DUF445 domain-containing protein [Sulfurimonas sp. RIFOXYD2_FULL_34_21]DAB28492.1 MAG TPA: DUF445 domain-containing protein [Sulfurimonas sp. UBA10385]
MKLNKSFITNLIASTLVILSFLFEGNFASLLLYSGLFALSGALTNQLAIHMLFERVPFLYGSGVIPARFEAFKESIKNLMMSQFFTKEQLENFFQNEEKKMNLTPIIEDTDFAPAFDALSKTVMESSFGGMLGMFGGERALEGLREPFSLKMKNAVIKIVNSEAFNYTLQNHLQKSSLNDDMLKSIESIIEIRLGELTPEMVKEMVHTLIKEHLSWLVLWGGVFGGLIGLVSSFLL